MDPSGFSACGYSYSDPECDKSTQHPIIWTKLPVENTQWLQYYGTTKFAYKYAKQFNYDGFAEGAHPGMDFGYEGESVPVYAGAYGYYEASDSNPAFYQPGWINLKVHNGERYVTAKYGHLVNIPNFKYGQLIKPDTIIGYTQYPGQEHLHMELWGTPNGVTPTMENPLPYFSPSLQNQILNVANAQNEAQIDRVTFYPGTQWQDPYNQPVLRRQSGWIYGE